MLTNLFCRDSWIQNITYPHFANYTCVKCLVQIFMGAKQLRLNMYENPFQLEYVDGSGNSIWYDANPVVDSEVMLYLYVTIILHHNNIKASKFSNVKLCCLLNIYTSAIITPKCKGI